MKNILKTKLLCIALILLCFSANAQTMVVENRVWSVVDFPGVFHDTYSTHHYTFRGDTVLNEKHYKNIYMSYANAPYKWEWPSGWIREDSGMVYYLQYSSAEEYMLYNFNLKAGDTYYHPLRQIDYTVDSVVVRDVQGQMLKHWYLSYYHLRGEWVEKYGTYYSPFIPFVSDVVGGDSELLCVSEADEVVYLNKQYNSCSIYSNEVITIDSQKGHIELFPMGNNEVRVKVETKGTLTFYISDGRLVHKEQITQPETTVCLPETGILLYRFTTAKGEVQTGKLVVR